MSVAPKAPAMGERNLPDYSRLEIPPGEGGTPVARAEAEFMHALVTRLKPRCTLEVGMGYGASAAFILAAGDGPHYAMDPLQHEYGGLGLRNLSRLGLDARLKFFPEYSHAALPRLLAEGLRVDFAFIDGGHRFDDIFLDFYYADQMLTPQGHILLHDAWMRSTQTVAAWVRRNKKNYRRVPTPIKNLILFQKIGEDDRAWNHFRGFGTWKSMGSHALNTFKRRVKAALRR